MKLRNFPFLSMQLNSAAITLGWFGLCFAIQLCMPAVLYSQRPQPPTTKDTPYQRWLPAPQSGSPSPELQAKMLSKLRELMSNPNSRNSLTPPQTPNYLPNLDPYLPRFEPKDAPKLDEANLEALKEAMKHFGSRLPKDLSPQDLDSLPTDWLSRALSNPKSMEQARQLIEAWRHMQPDSTQHPSTSPNSLENQPQSVSPDASLPSNGSEDSNALPGDIPPETGRQPKEVSKEKRFPQADRKEDGSKTLPSKPSTDSPEHSSSAETSKSNSSLEDDSSAKEATDANASSRKTSKDIGKSNKADASNKSTSDATSPLDAPDINNRYQPKTPSNHAQPWTPEPNQGNRSSSEPAIDPSQYESLIESIQQMQRAYEKSVPGSTPQNPPSTSPRFVPNTSSAGRSDPSVNDNSQSLGGSELNQGVQPNGTNNNNLKSLNSTKSTEPRRPSELRGSDLANSPYQSGGQAPSTSDSLSNLIPRDFDPSSVPWDKLREMVNKSSDLVPRNSSPVGSSSNPSINIQEELKRSGVERTFQKLVEQARKNAISQKPSHQSKSNTEPESFWNSWNKSISSNTKKHESSSKNSSVNRNEQANKNQAGRSNPSTAPTTRSTPARSGSDQSFFNQMTETMKSNRPMTRPSSSSSGGSWKMPDFRVGTAWLSAIAPILMFLAIGLACLFAVGWFARRRAQQQERMEVERLAKQAIPTEQVRNRQDLVLAFHQLAKSKLYPAEEWWTCTEVKERFGNVPSQDPQALETLSNLYEEARYYPESHQMSETKMEAARTALNQYH